MPAPKPTPKSARGKAGTAAPKPKSDLDAETLAELFPETAQYIKWAKGEIGDIALFHAEYENGLSAVRLLRRRRLSTDLISLPSFANAAKKLSYSADRLGEHLLRISQIIQRELCASDFKRFALPLLPLVLRECEKAYNLLWPFTDEVPPVEERQELILIACSVIALMETKQVKA
jgi:hypothetical protein